MAQNDCYEPLLDHMQLLAFLARLPVAVRVEPRYQTVIDERDPDKGGRTEITWAWNVLAESGQTDTVQQAVHQAFASLLTQLLGQLLR